MASTSRGRDAGWSNSPPAHLSPVDPAGPVYSGRLDREACQMQMTLIDQLYPVAISDSDPSAKVVRLEVRAGRCEVGDRTTGSREL